MAFAEAPVVAALVAALAALLVGLWWCERRHNARTAPATAAVQARRSVQGRAEAGDLDAMAAHLALEALHRAVRSSGRHLTGDGLAAAAADPRSAAARLRQEGTPDAYAAAVELEALASHPARKTITAAITRALARTGHTTTTNGDDRV